MKGLRVPERAENLYRCVVIVFRKLMPWLKPVVCVSSGAWINLLKPTGHVMYQHFNIQQLYFLPTHCIYVFCIYLRTNSDLYHL